MPPDDLDRIIAALAADHSITDWIAAISALLTAFIAIGALFYAAGQIKEARAARELTSDLEVKRAQPYVVMYTEESAATDLAIDLVIKNFGPTAATDVRVVLDPWPERAGRSDDSARVGIPAFPVLAPGQEWRTSWVWTPDREHSKLPERHEGFVTFLGINDEEFTSPVVLDLGIYAHREWVEVRGIHDAAQALRDIRDNQKKWTEDLHGSLSVVSRDGAAKDEKERIRMEELRRRHAERTARANTPPEQAVEPPSPDNEQSS